MRAVIRFLYREGVKPFEIHSRMKAVYGGIESCLDDAPRPGAPVKSFWNDMKLREILDRIVTGDESWIHHHIPDSERSNAEWHHKCSPTPKKPRITASAGKSPLTIFL
ncbi:hypothetical protein LAZ67_2003615 [Cordylochernes scorpioides]|uniref:Transposase n=1 Tax=Cordylochernes scorpioides TaxID=51811 RepID=A0ABY6K384_9ARAC|nr:hypothetical protein LAZ67_2003615 [Cordylochernes scorpioides]